MPSPHWPARWLPLASEKLATTNAEWAKWPKLSLDKLTMQVTEKDSFEIVVPTVDRTLNLYTAENIFDPEKHEYHRVCFGAFIASAVCGISTKNIGTGLKLADSLVMFHFWYTISRFIKYPKELEEYNEYRHIVAGSLPSNVKARIVERKVKDADGNWDLVDYHVGGGKDWRRFIATESYGINPKGMKLLQRSVEAYMIAILGSQVKLETAIIGAGAASYQVQNKVKERIVELSAIPDPTSMLTLLKTNIAGSHVRIDTALTPGISLLPSSFLFLKSIKGLNDIVRYAKYSSTFGKSTKNWSDAGTATGGGTGGKPWTPLAPAKKAKIQPWTSLTPAKKKVDPKSKGTPWTDLTPSKSRGIPWTDLTPAERATKWVKLVIAEHTKEAEGSPASGGGMLYWAMGGVLGYVLATRM